MRNILFRQRNKYRTPPALESIINIIYKFLDNYPYQFDYGRKCCASPLDEDGKPLDARSTTCLGAHNSDLTGSQTDPLLYDSGWIVCPFAACTEPDVTTPDSNDPSQPEKYANGTIIYSQNPICQMTPEFNNKPGIVSRTSDIFFLFGPKKIIFQL